MTIAKRLVQLLAVPLAALLGLALVTRYQLSKIAERTGFVAESRIDAMATLGNLSRSFAELRVDVRSYLLASNQMQRAAWRVAFDEDESEVTFVGTLRRPSCVQRPGAALDDAVSNTRRRVARHGAARHEPRRFRASRGGCRPA